MCLGRIHHRFTEVFVSSSKLVRLHLMLKALNLAVEVAHDRLDWRAWSKCRTISEVIINVGGDDGGWLEFLQSLPASASIAQTAQCVSTFRNNSFHLDGFSFLSWMCDSHICKLSERILTL